MVDSLLEDEMVDINPNKTVVLVCGNAIEEYFDKNSKQWDTNRGGTSRLELYRHTGTTSKKQKRTRGVV